MEPAAVIVHAECDAPAASALAAYLEAGCRHRVALEGGAIAPGASLVEALRRALGAESSIVLLSPAAVAVRCSGAEWAEAFEEAPEARVCSLLLADCAVPALLRRRRIIDAREDALAAHRLVKRWLIDATADPAPDWPAPESAASAAELESLREALGDRAGTIRLEAGSPIPGAFVSANWADFERVVRLDCTWRPPENLYGELAARLGLATEGPREADREAVERALRNPRLLLVLENLASLSHAPVGGPLCSVLTTEAAEAAPPSATELIDAMRVWGSNPGSALGLLPAAHAAWGALSGPQWDLAKQLGRLSFLVTNHHRRFAEAALWLDRLTAGAMRHHDRATAIDSAKEKAWLVERWGESAAEPPPCGSPPGVQLGLFDEAAFAASSSM
jgi:hypothetical protein